jgi:hypothetical protein
MQWGWNGWRMKPGEYRASVEGLNIFFGALLGVVMVGIENIPTEQYVVLLAFVAAVVMLILTISGSPRRLLYAVGIGGLLAWLTWRGGPTLIGIPVPAKLLPTLSVWVGATILVEFLPRERDAED